MWQMLVQGSDKRGALEHGWTYSAHPICTAAGIANLELIGEMVLVKAAGEVETYSVANWRYPSEWCGSGTASSTRS